MPHSHAAACAHACFRCRADLARQFLRGRPVPSEESLGTDKYGKTYRVVCSDCGAVNLVRFAAERRFAT